MTAPDVSAFGDPPSAGAREELDALIAENLPVIVRALLESGANVRQHGERAMYSEEHLDACTREGNRQEKIGEEFARLAQMVYRVRLDHLPKSHRFSQFLADIPEDVADEVIDRMPLGRMIQLAGLDDG